MGFTKEQKSEKKVLSKTHTNPFKKKDLSLNKSEFYSFLQELNYKTEIGLE